jgi:hypothetical protein
MKIIYTKSTHSIDLPLSTKLYIDGNEFEVLGLVKQEYVENLVYQYWVVAETKRLEVDG